MLTLSLRLLNVEYVTRNPAVKGIWLNEKQTRLPKRALRIR